MFFDACKITSWSVILTACNIRIIFLISFFHYIWHLKSFAECLKIFSFYLWLTQILHKLTTSFDTKCSTYKNSSGKDKKITGVSICDNLMDTSNTGWWQSQLNCMHTYYKYSKVCRFCRKNEIQRQLCEKKKKNIYIKHFKVWNGPSIISLNKILANACLNP